MRYPEADQYAGLLNPYGGPPYEDEDEEPAAQSAAERRRDALLSDPAHQAAVDFSLRADALDVEARAESRLLYRTYVFANDAGQQATLDGGFLGWSHPLWRFTLRLPGQRARTYRSRRAAFKSATEAGYLVRSLGH